jgi:hypothetical protein
VRGQNEGTIFEGRGADGLPRYRSATRRDGKRRRIRRQSLRLALARFKESGGQPFANNRPAGPSNSEENAPAFLNALPWEGRLDRIVAVRHRLVGTAYRPATHYGSSPRGQLAFRVARHTTACGERWIELMEPTGETKTAA